MDKNAGRKINGVHFLEIWTTRRGIPTLICRIDGKIVARAQFVAARDAAKKEERNT